MFKEKGYDEFLAEQIRIGREQARAGQGIPLEVAKKQIQARLEQKIQEMELSRNRDVVYG
ncbi:hypothetical protein [Mannheimia sp. ZY171111]|uniref:hypothetical protein n=1 Tax=Mannheimia sp. ZY171111 TaxID=2679995 RepID=UPI001ADDC728|nr:hypothetical protein [Mannheimia sp. ZY171111]QTM01898.1 hypothetical protein GM698_10020 [Mannheimia sp. ZY171111]